MYFSCPKCATIISSEDPNLWGCCNPGLEGEASESDTQPADIKNDLFGVDDEYQDTSDGAQNVSQDDDTKLHVIEHIAAILNDFDIASYLNTDDTIPIYTVNIATQNMTPIFQNQQFLNDYNKGFLRDTPPSSPEEIFRMNRLPENVPQIQNPPIRSQQSSEDKRKIGEIGRKIKNIKDKRVTICPIKKCRSTFEKKNKSRDLSDHLLNHHFSEELIRDNVKDERPHRCPLRGAVCDANKIFKNYQDLKRHYGGSVHGKLLTYLDEKLASERGLQAKLVDNKIVISKI